MTRPTAPRPLARGGAATPTVAGRRPSPLNAVPSRRTSRPLANPVTTGGGEADGRNGPLAALAEVPRMLWRRAVQPLGDYGFGERSVWEGGVEIFMVSDAALLALAWLRGFQLHSLFRKYTAVVEFGQACGICVGTPLRIRGDTVGSVVHVDSSLRSMLPTSRCISTLCLPSNIAPFQ